jgi:hypothetical protein
MATTNQLWGLDEPGPVDPGAPGILGRLDELVRYLRGNSPGVGERMAADRQLRDKLASGMTPAETMRDEVRAQAQGWEIRPDIQKARGIIAKKGFAGLFQALRNDEWLPAAGVLAPILAELGLADGEMGRESDANPGT